MTASATLYSQNFLKLSRDKLSYVLSPQRQVVGNLWKLLRNNVCAKFLKTITILLYDFYDRIVQLNIHNTLWFVWFEWGSQQPGGLEQTDAMYILFRVVKSGIVEDAKSRQQQLAVCSK